MITKKSNKVTFKFDEKTNHKVYLAGDFNGWNYASTPLTKGTDGKWKIELNLNQGEYQFKYYTDNQWYNDYSADKYINNGYGAENSVVVVDNNSGDATTKRTSRSTSDTTTGAKTTRTTTTRPTTRGTSKSTTRSTKDSTHSQH